MSKKLSSGEDMEANRKVKTIKLMLDTLEGAVKRLKKLGFKQKDAVLACQGLNSGGNGDSQHICLQIPIFRRGRDDRSRIILCSKFALFLQNRYTFRVFSSQARKYLERSCSAALARTSPDSRRRAPSFESLPFCKSKIATYRGNSAK